MTFGPSLNSGSESVNFHSVKQANKRTLFNALDDITGTKALVWDSELIASFDMVSGFKELREHNVKHIFQLQRGSHPQAPVDTVVYIVRPQLSTMSLLGASLKVFGKDKNRDCFVLFCPINAILCEKKLMDLDVMGLVSGILSLPIYLYTIEVDLLSMERSDCLSNCVLYSDQSILHHITTGLLMLEEIYGLIPNIYFKGFLAETVQQMLKQGRKEKPTTVPHSSISSMIIFDRTIDILTPLITQLTYEGLIDELFTIKNATVKLPRERFTSENVAGGSSGGSTSEQNPESSSAGSQLKSLKLNSEEELFGELRDLNFSAVGPALRRTITEVSAQMNQRHNAQTVREYKEFVKRLPQLQQAKQSAGNHTAIAEMIKEHTTKNDFLEVIQCEQTLLNNIETDKPVPLIEEMIFKADSLPKVLRLICIQSYVNDGLKPKVYEQYKKDIMASYGLPCLSMWMNLEKCGLIKSQNAKSQSISSTLTKLADGTTFSAIKKAFKLIVDDVNEISPTDLSYVYSGYAPLLPRMVQYCKQPGWRSINEILRRLPGPTGMDDEENHHRLMRSQNVQRPQDETKIVLVVFIGGATYAEISAIRFLASKDETTQYLMLTTSMLTGKSFLSSISETVTDNR